MNERIKLGEFAKSALASCYVMKSESLGEDAHLSKRGLSFDIEAGEIEGIGHYCILNMRAVLGLMHMETVVIAPTHVDAPLINVDWVRALGKETQIVELYDNQIAPWPEPFQAEFNRILSSNEDLPDAPEGDARWYSSILYPCSCHKSGKGLSDRFSSLAQDYLVSYIAHLSVAEPCDVAEKKERVRQFAQRLFDEGGPAVDTVANLFGTQTAHRVILEHMYGVG